VNIYLAEFIGTAILILLGNGVVANVVLANTKGHGGEWIVICAGWGFAVFTAVACVGRISGAHINPAVTIGLAAAGNFARSSAGELEWLKVTGYIAAQLAGGFAGAVLVYLFYRQHYEVTEDADGKLATFATVPAIRGLPTNFLCEVIATFVLVYAVLMTVDPFWPAAAAVGAEEVQVGLIVFAIGLGLGGTTGYAINPARDLAPRLAHALLPIPGKRDSDWSYAPIPVLGPIAGGLLAALLHVWLQAGTAVG